MITYGGKKQSANIKNPKFIAIVLIKINICRLSQVSNIAVNLLLYFRNPPSKIHNKRRSARCFKRLFTRVYTLLTVSKLNY